MRTLRQASVWILLATFAVIAATPASAQPKSSIGISQGGAVKSTWSDGQFRRTEQREPAKARTSSTRSTSRSSASASDAAPAPISEYDRRAATCQLTHVALCFEWAREALPDDPANPRPAPRPPSRAEIQATAREVVLNLQLPAHTPRIGPDPEANEWGMAVVGHPLWLWTDASRTVATSRVQYGMSFDLSARLQRIDFAMGDGRTVTCSASTRYTVGVRPGAPSPTCGHVYETASLPRGSYTVTATSHWSIAWSGMGLSGTIPASFTAARAVPVGELQSVVTG